MRLAASNRLACRAHTHMSGLQLVQLRGRVFKCLHVTLTQVPCWAFPSGSNLKLARGPWSKHWLLAQRESVAALAATSRSTRVSSELVLLP